MLTTHHLIGVFLARRLHFLGNPWDYILDGIILLSTLWVLSANHRGKTSIEGFLIVLGILAFATVVILLIVGLLAGLS